MTPEEQQAIREHSGTAASEPTKPDKPELCWIASPRRLSENSYEGYSFFSRADAEFMAAARTEALRDALDAANAEIVQLRARLAEYKRARQAVYEHPVIDNGTQPHASVRPGPHSQQGGCECAPDSGEEMTDIGLSYREVDAALRNIDMAGMTEGIRRTSSV